MCRWIYCSYFHPVFALIFLFLLLISSSSCNHFSKRIKTDCTKTNQKRWWANFYNWKSPRSWRIITTAQIHRIQNATERWSEWKLCVADQIIKRCKKNFFPERFKQDLVTCMKIDSSNEWKKNWSPFKCYLSFNLYKHVSVYFFFSSQSVRWYWERNQCNGLPRIYSKLNWTPRLWTQKRNIIYCSIMNTLYPTRY